MDNETLNNLHRICENELGAVFAADDVFTTVVGMAASEVEGVFALADLSTGEAQAKLGVKAMSRCMDFDFDDNTISVTLSLIISFGYNLPEVCGKVQSKVIGAVTDIIGYEAKSVNIGIADIKLK